MLDDIGGQVVVFFVLVVAAAEVVVGLGIIVAILRTRPGRHRRRHLDAEGLRARHVLDLVWLDPRACRWPASCSCSSSAAASASRVAGWLATLMCGGAFARHRRRVRRPARREPAEQRAVHHRCCSTWLPVGGLQVDVGFLVDPLSITMALFVTGIGTLIHLYSIGYMHGDPKFSKFFVYLNLFVFSMLMLVLGDNLLITFLGWEGVGACSYFLISFWFTERGQRLAPARRPSSPTASVTGASWSRCSSPSRRVGIAHLLTTAATSAPDDRHVAHDHRHRHRRCCCSSARSASRRSCRCIVWLPDAMAGPTPVSALIHAATMVTAGVYLMTRVSPLLARGYTVAAGRRSPWSARSPRCSPPPSRVAQNDIKKVLAYSTVSQLGYMFLAVGSGAYVAAIFHMITHAFFKALLFLGAGSVIHGMHDEQDMRRMGGLRKFMPITAFTFIVGWLAIAGVPPFAGFWSKDEILLVRLGQAAPALWVVGLVTALLTAYYMSRQVFMVFFGEERWHGGPRRADSPRPRRRSTRRGARRVATTTPRPHARVAVDDDGAARRAGRAVDRRRGAQPAVHRTTEVPRELAGAGRRVRPSADDRRARRSCKCALAAVADLAVRSSASSLACPRLPAAQAIKPVEPEVLAARLVLRRGRQRLRRRSRASEAFEGPPVRPRRHRRRGQRRRLRRCGCGAPSSALAQTGYVRNYALGIAVGAFILLGLLPTRAVG